MSRLKTSLPESLAAAVKANIADWKTGGKMQRLWQRDATLWTGDDEANWLGWLDIIEDQIAHPIELRSLAKEVWSAGFKDILLLGMGGSSLCPEVLRMTFGKIAGYPDLHVLDSTDPAQVKAFENKIDIARTLFIVSSKSGTTLEPNIFKQYFFERTKQAVGADKAGSHFIAVTDPGFENAAGGGSGSFPAGFLWPAIDRRTLFRAIELRHGSCGGDGIGHEEISRPHAGNGAGVRTCRAPSKRILARCWELFWARRRGAAAIKLRSSLRRTFPISAPGSNSCWPSLRGKSEKALSRWIVKNWRRRRFMAMIAYLPTSTRRTESTLSRTRS